MKTCKRCGEEKPEGEFFVDRSRKDGRSVWCRECGKMAKRQSWAAEPEHYRERGRQYRAENREHIRELERQRYAASLEHHRARGRERYAENREHRLGVLNRSRHTRRARKAASAQPELCARGKALHAVAVFLRARGHNVAVDHIHPLKYISGPGPGNHISNLRLLHASANGSKLNRLDSELTADQRALVRAGLLAPTGQPWLEFAASLGCTQADCAAAG